jgi:oligosaccharide repeat unit polymerase
VTTAAWLFSVIPASGLIILAWIARRQLRSWLAPSAVFSLYWAVGLLMPLVLAPDFSMWPGAPWLILVMAFAFHLGVQIGGWAARHVSPAADVSAVSLRLRWGGPLLVLSSISGLGVGVLLITVAGIPLGEVIRHPALIADIGRQFATLRYGFEESPPVAVSLLNGVQFFSGCLAGVWFACDGSAGRRLIGVLPLLPAILNSFLVNARTGLYWQIIFVLSSYAACVVLKRLHVQFGGGRRLMHGVALVGAFVAFYVAIQIIREGESADLRAAWTTKTRVSTLAPPMSFSHWLRDGWIEERPAWGARTFGGVFDQLKIVERRPGLGWEEDLEIPVNTNVYTAFRQLIEDATVPGSILALFVSGLIAGRAYLRVLSGAFGWVPVLAVCYAAVIGSYLANWMTYNSCLLGWALFTLAVGELGPRLLRVRVRGQVGATPVPVHAG